MTFYTFMIRNYAGSQSPAGDLARDMREDKDTFPRNRSCKFDGWHKILLDYLIGQGACDTCLETFEQCWKEYVGCEKKRSNRS